MFSRSTFWAITCLITDCALPQPLPDPEIRFFRLHMGQRSRCKQQGEENIAVESVAFRDAVKRPNQDHHAVRCPFPFCQQPEANEYDAQRGNSHPNAHILVKAVQGGSIRNPVQKGGRLNAGSGFSKQCQTPIYIPGGRFDQPVCENAV